MPRSEDVRITTETVLAPEMVKLFWPIYERTMRLALEDRAAARQWLTEREFHEEMSDASVIKFVSWSAEDEPLAMGFMATDLTRLAWVNPRFYEVRFPEEFAANKVWYFGALLTRDDRQGNGHVVPLVEEFGRYIGSRKAIACADFCVFNVKEVQLPELIADVGSKVCNLELIHLDSQEYFAFRTFGLS